MQASKTLVLVAAEWAAAATCFSEREAESREVWDRISFFGGGGATSDADVAGP